MFNKKEITILENRLYDLEEKLKQLNIFNDKTITGYIEFSIHECPKCKHRTLHENRFDKNLPDNRDPDYFRHADFCLTCGTRSARQLSATWIEI